jgi:hypothetical protein
LLPAHVLDVRHVWLLVHVATRGGLSVTEHWAERDDGLGHQLSLPLADGILCWEVIMELGGMLLPSPWLHRL